LLVRLLRSVVKNDPASITRQQIVTALDRIALTAPIGANRSLANCQAFLNWAVGRGHIGVNPALGIPKPSPERIRERTPSLDEIVEIWRAAEELGYPFGPAVKLLMILPTSKARPTLYGHFQPIARKMSARCVCRCRRWRATLFARRCRVQCARSRVICSFQRPEKLRLRDGPRQSGGWTQSLGKIAGVLVTRLPCRTGGFMIYGGHLRHWLVTNSRSIRRSPTGASIM
jgi:hypothetical protein